MLITGKAYPKATAISQRKATAVLRLETWLQPQSPSKCWWPENWKWTKMSTRVGSSPTYLICSVFAGLLGYRSLFQIMPKLVNVFIFFGHFICKPRKRMVHVNLSQWGWSRASSMFSGHPEQNRLFIIAITSNYTRSALQGSANKSYQSALVAYLLRC